MLSVLLLRKGTPARIKTDGLSLPSYPFPEDAARALAHAVRYGIWAETPEGVVPQYTNLKTSEGKALIADVLASIETAGEKDGRWLLHDGVARLLSAYGVTMAT